MDITFQEMMVDILHQHTEIENKTILEIGSDPWLLAAKRFIQLGAKKVFASDLSPNWTTEEHSQVETIVLDARTCESSFEKGDIDIVFGINILEHLREIPKILSSVYNILKPGGIFFLHGHPIWSSSRGHHAMFGHMGSTFTFSNDSNPVPLWGHLYMERNELKRELSVLGYHEDEIGAAINWTYDNDQINRMSRNSLIEQISSGPFMVLSLSEDRLEYPDEATIVRLKHGSWWDPTEDYSVRSMLFVLKKE